MQFNEDCKAKFRTYQNGRGLQISLHGAPGSIHCTVHVFERDGFVLAAFTQGGFEDHVAALKAVQDLYVGRNDVQA